MWQPALVFFRCGFISLWFYLWNTRSHSTPESKSTERTLRRSDVGRACGAWNSLFSLSPLAGRRNGGRLYIGHNSPSELSQYLRCHCFPKLVIKEKLNPAELCTPGKYGPVTLLMQWLRDCCTHRGRGRGGGGYERGERWGDKDKGKSNLRFPTQPLFTHRACTYCRTERAAVMSLSIKAVRVCECVCAAGPLAPGSVVPPGDGAVSVKL